MLKTVLVEEKRRKIVKATFGSIVRASFIRLLSGVKAGCQPCLNCIISISIFNVDTCVQIFIVWL